MAHPIQIILTRQLGAYLSVPLFLFDPNGNLIFYNEPAEAILGRRFDETGALSLEEWSSALTRFDDEGKRIPHEDLPLIITLTEKRPAYKRYHTRGPDDVVRHIEATSIPLTGLQGDFLGALVLFWELSE
jgi:PAS domain-containing protein